MYLKSKNKGKRNIFNLFKPNKKDKQNNTPIKKSSTTYININSGAIIRLYTSK